MRGRRRCYASEVTRRRGVVLTPTRFSCTTAHIEDPVSDSGSCGLWSTPAGRNAAGSFLKRWRIAPVASVRSCRKSWKQGFRDKREDPWSPRFDRKLRCVDWR
jgi:hypothetical protein